MCTYVYVCIYYIYMYVQIGNVYSIELCESEVVTPTMY